MFGDDFIDRDEPERRLSPGNIDDSEDFTAM
jgi:hypothetical protein